MVGLGDFGCLLASLDLKGYCGTPLKLVGISNSIMNKSFMGKLKFGLTMHKCK